jgi:hypothetical protein
MKFFLYLLTCTLMLSLTTVLGEATPPPTPAGWSSNGTADIIVSASHPGQNNASPTANVFNNHVITEITSVQGLPIATTSSPYTTVYDPSYGYIAPLSSLTESQQKWQDDSLGGYRWFYTDQFGNPRYIDTLETKNKPEVQFVTK